MIPGIDLIDLIKLVGVIGVALIVFAESGLLIGFFLPGDSLLFTAGFLTHAGILPINIHVLVLILFAAAVAGDSVGYTFGRKAGPKIFSKPDARLFKKSHVQTAQEFYEKHGGLAIILARFVPVVRTFAPIVAGVAGMHYKRFLAYNVLGAFLWACGVTYAGYFLGAWFERMGWEIDQILLPIVAGIILLSIAPPLIHVFKDKQRRAAFWQAVKRELNTLRAR